MTTGNQANALIAEVRRVDMAGKETRQQKRPAGGEEFEISFSVCCYLSIATTEQSSIVIFSFASIVRDLDVCWQRLNRARADLSACADRFGDLQSTTTQRLEFSPWW